MYTHIHTCTSLRMGSVTQSDPSVSAKQSAGAATAAAHQAPGLMTGEREARSFRQQLRYSSQELERSSRQGKREAREMGWKLKEGP